MSEKLYNEMVFCVENYNDKYQMFLDIGTTLKTLLENEYIVVVRYDEPALGIVILEYEHDEHDNPYGCANPVWMIKE